MILKSLTLLVLGWFETRRSLDHANPSDGLPRWELHPEERKTLRAADRQRINQQFWNHRA